MSRLDLSLCEARTHYVNGEPMFGDIPEGLEQIQLGFGCFWGAERILWKLDGVHVTSVGYSGGHTRKPDYRLVCTGKTGHAEMCHVVYDPKQPKGTARAMMSVRNIVLPFSPILTVKWRSPKRR